MLMNEVTKNVKLLRLDKKMNIIKKVEKRKKGKNLKKVNLGKGNRIVIKIPAKLHQL